MDRLVKLAPFATGNIGEVSDKMVRIYDNTGYPLIEVFSSEEIADAICKALNHVCGTPE